MILLDTDHLSVFTDSRDPRHVLLNSHLENAEEPVACSIVSVEEAVRGWLAIINRRRDVRAQVPSYAAAWAALRCLERMGDCALRSPRGGPIPKLRRQRIRIGSMDLKIASIALVSDALLISANMRDYSLNGFS